VGKLVQAFLAEGYSVQLAYDQTETTDYGFVKVRDGSGKILAESSEYLRNPFSRTFEKRTADIMKAAKDAGLDQLEKEVAAPDSDDGKLDKQCTSDSEASTRVASKEEP
jgi:hypothetical protein